MHARVAALAITIGLFAAGCGTGTAGENTAATSPPSGATGDAGARPSSSATTQAGSQQAAPALKRVGLSTPIPHIHGAVVGADGSVLAGTHEGVRVITPSGQVSAVGPRDDLMGMTGEPGTTRLISSGHPGQGSRLPNPIGLIRSEDGGQTWTPVSLAGEIDFHALATDGDVIVGFDGVSGLVTSQDGGKTWSKAASMAAMSLAMVGDQVWATTPDGLMHSSDKAATFAALPGAPPLRLISAGGDGSLWGVDGTGMTWRSRDGKAWDKHLQLPEVHAIAVADYTTAYAVSDSSLITLTG